MAKHNNIPDMSNRQWAIRNAFVERLLKQSKDENKKLTIQELKKILKIYDDNKLYNYADGKIPIPKEIANEMDKIYLNAKPLDNKSKTLTQEQKLVAKKFQHAVDKFRVALPTKPNTVGLKMNRGKDDDYIIQEVANRKITRWGKTAYTKQFTPKELAEREARYDQKYGRLVNYNNAPASTTGTTSKQKANTKAFVLTADGKLYTDQHLHMAEKDGRPIFTHAALGNEKPVKLAGMIKIDDYGRIYHIDTFSGHYQPSVDELYKAIKYMQKNMPGVFAKDLEIEFSYNGRDYKYNLPDFISVLEKPGKTSKPFWQELEDKKQEEKQAYYNKIQNTKSIVLQVGKVPQSIEQQKEKIAQIFNDPKSSINFAYIDNNKGTALNKVNSNLETFVGQLVKDNNIEIMQTLLDAGISKRPEFKNVLPIIRTNTSMSDFVRNYKPQEIQLAKATTARERRRARIAEEATKRVLPTEPAIIPKTEVKNNTTETTKPTIKPITMVELAAKRKARRGLPPIATTEVTKRPLPAIEPVNHIVRNANKPLADIKNPSVINIEKPKQRVGQRLAERLQNLKERFLERDKEDNNTRRVGNNNQHQDRGGRNIF